ncbi:hypothetical protein GGI07_003215 [Coemansia sp. Benny D115]|nr:hypothetical protein GGI07_003215 [Coemansia sp. Benny D115]
MSLQELNRRRQTGFTAGQSPIRDGSLICTVNTGFEERVFDIKMLPSPNEHLLVACSMDGSVKVFDTNCILSEANASKMFGKTTIPELGSAITKPGFCVRTFDVHTAAVKRIAVMPDLPYEFISCSEDGSARHFDIREPAPAQSGTSNQRQMHRGGRVVADYRTLGVELYALDANPFHSSIFGVGGTLTSIMIHDRRMPYHNSVSFKNNTLSNSSSSINWSGHQCVVRLRRCEVPSRCGVFEDQTDEMVTGLKFSRDVANQVIGSWSYDGVYLFDLNRSTTFMDAVSRNVASSSKRSRDMSTASSMKSLSPLIKRVRSGRLSSEYIILENYEQDDEEEKDDDDDDDSEAAEREDIEGSSTSHSRPSFIPGQHTGVRLLTREEAPYLFDASTPETTDEDEDSEESSNADEDAEEGDMMDDVVSSGSLEVTDQSHLCNNCGGSMERFSLFGSRLVENDIEMTDTSHSLSKVEYGMSVLSFGTFVECLKNDRPRDAVDAISTVIHSLENEDSQSPEPETLESPLLIGFYTESLNDMQIREMLMKLYYDASAERRRIISLLYNNRAYAHARTFHKSWSTIFDGHLKMADVSLFGRDKADMLVNMLKETKESLDAALRDCLTALRMNHNNVLAHYNRLLLSWDSTRLDIMIFMLVIQPMIGTGSETPTRSRETSPGHSEDGSESSLHIIRAEFGDLSHRLSSLLTDMRANFSAITESLKAISGFGRMYSYVLDESDDNYDDGYEDISNDRKEALAYLLHSTERFFELPRIRAAQMLDDVRLVSERWTTNDIIGNFEMQSNDCSSSDYRLVFDNLSQVWNALSSSQPLPTEHTFNVHSIITDAEAHHPGHPCGYMWHDQFPSICKPCIGDDDDDFSYSESPSFTHMLENSEHDSSESIERNISEQTSFSSIPNSSIEETSSLFSSPSSSSADEHQLSMSSEQEDSDQSSDEDSDSSETRDNTGVYSSHDGRWFIWNKESMSIVQVLHGDNEVVNNIEGHPTLPIIAVSGIDSEVHIFGLCQGGPVAAHRRNFPLVSEQQISAVGLTGVDEKRTYVDLAYAKDPYYEALKYSGNLTLSSGINGDELTIKIPRKFPAVSDSCIGKLSQIIEHNDEIRRNNLAHASLTSQIIARYLFQSMARRGIGLREAEESTESESESQSGSDSDSDSDSDNERYPGVNIVFENID